MIKLTEKTKVNILLVCGTVIILALMYFTGTCSISLNKQSGELNLTGFLTGSQTIQATDITDVKLLEQRPDITLISGTTTLRCICGTFNQGEQQVQGYLCKPMLGTSGSLCVQLTTKDGVTYFCLDTDEKTRTVFEALSELLTKE